MQSRMISRANSSSRANAETAAAFHLLSALRPSSLTPRPFALCPLPSQADTFRLSPVALVPFSLLLSSLLSPALPCSSPCSPPSPSPPTTRPSQVYLTSKLSNLPPNGSTTPARPFLVEHSTTLSPLSRLLPLANSPLHAWQTCR